MIVGDERIRLRTRDTFIVTGDIFMHSLLINVLAPIDLVSVFRGDEPTRETARISPRCRQVDILELVQRIDFSTFTS